MAGRDPVHGVILIVDSSVDKRLKYPNTGSDTLILDVNFYLLARRFASPWEISTSSYPLSVHNAVDDR